MDESKPDINKILFIQLVSMLAMSAMQQMGKLVDPGTGKAAVHLEAAQATIDMLDMLCAKTKNNLAADEEKLMKDTLASLKMNFVETKDQEQRKPEVKAKAESPESGKEPPTPGVESKPATDTGAGDDKTPRYHKKYE